MRRGGPSSGGHLAATTDERDTVKWTCNLCHRRLQRPAIAVLGPGYTEERSKTSKLISRRNLRLNMMIWRFRPRLSLATVAFLFVLRTAKGVLSRGTCTDSTVSPTAFEQGSSEQARGGALGAGGGPRVGFTGGWGGPLLSRPRGAFWERSAPGLRLLNKTVQFHC